METPTVNPSSVTSGFAVGRHVPRNFSRGVISFPDTPFWPSRMSLLRAYRYSDRWSKPFSNERQLTCLYSHRAFTSEIAHHSFIGFLFSATEVTNCPNNCGRMYPLYLCIRGEIYIRDLLSEIPFLILNVKYDKASFCPNVEIDWKTQR